MTGYESKRAMAQAKTIDKVNWADHEPDGLVQPEQEPVACKHEWFRTGAMEPRECRCIKCGAWNTTPPQRTEQEPVACKPLCELCVKRGYTFCANAVKTTPIYTSPPQRPEERNFCPRCGKRTKDIHTCTPPQGLNSA